jgi:hypothetical protein
VVTPNRWQRVEQEQQAKARADEVRNDERWSSWRGRWPLGFTAAFLVLALLFLVLGLVYRHRDAPLREPGLPTVTGTVLDRRVGKGSSATIRYSVEGRTIERRFAWGGGPPDVGATTPIAYLPGSPSRARPLGDAWTPGYQQLLLFAGTSGAGAPVVYVSGVLGARHRLRKRQLAQQKEDGGMAGSLTRNERT